jgi:hypothetical protein
MPICALKTGNRRFSSDFHRVDLRLSKRHGGISVRETGLGNCGTADVRQFVVESCLIET